MESSAIKFCARHKVRKPQTHRMEARRAFILLIKKRKGKKLVSKTKRHGGNPRKIPPVRLSPQSPTLLILLIHVPHSLYFFCYLFTKPKRFEHFKVFTIA